MNASSGCVRRLEIGIRRLTWILACLLVAIGGQVSAQNLVSNPSFETLGQAGWTMSDDDGGGWSDSSNSPPTTDGSNGLRGSYDDPGSLVGYQDVVLPAGGTYTFQVAVGCEFESSSVNDFCRIDITNTSAATVVHPNPGTDTLASTGANVLQAVYARDASQGGQAQADTALFDISGLAGQTVRIRFMSATSSGPQNFNIDNVRLLRVVPSLAVPTLSAWSMVLLAGLLALGAFVVLRRRHRHFG